jgi:hypothetical protein
VTATDNDVQDLVLSASTLTVNEGGSGTFTVRLAFQPSANVTVNVASTDTATASVTPATLTFTSATYATPQTVTVTGVEDVNVATNSATVNVSSAGLTTRSVTVTSPDNDTQAIVLTTTSITLAEGSSSTVGVSLAYQPSGNITVSLTTSNSSYGGISASTLAFTPADWNVAQSPTITTIEDATFGHESATVTLTSPGLTTRTVFVQNVDDDLINVNPTSLGTVCWFDGASFNVKLNGPPYGGSITLDLTSSNAARADVGPPTMTFTSANWNVNQEGDIVGVSSSNLGSVQARVDGPYQNLVSATVSLSAAPAVCNL